ncbi:MAG TPA: RdgB/HAM1 family non-canonical purine NTP pyrophosphatase [Candidatus Nitrosocosmicus sp.]|nr:RdgB/HAM1 family non-canonical purine NTP pyrophosphatase [Candidatus Nitrosocosmicus sp.]
MLYFVTSNDNKFREIKELLNYCDSPRLFLQHRKMKLKEIQSNSLEEVAKVKANHAFELIGDEVIVEDDGLFIESLNDFPGVYSSFVFDTLGNDGILDLLKNKKNRKATFKSIIAFYNGKTAKIFSGQVRGLISEYIFKEGWGFDPIFIPENMGIPFGQMDLNSKNKYSHRRLALEEFYAWYTEYNPEPENEES